MVKRTGGVSVASAMAIIVIAGCNVIPPLANLPPVLEIADSFETVAGQAVVLDASASFDPDGEIVTYRWSRDSQADLEGATVEMTFAEPGTYEVTLTVFDDEAASTSVVITVVVNDDTPPDPVEYMLEVTVDPPGAGTVTLEPAGGIYAAGTTVTAIATAASGFVFQEWRDESGTASGTIETLDLVIDRDLSVTALFRRVNTTPTLFTLTVDVSPGEGGVVGLDPPGGTYERGSLVTVTATPADGYEFAAYSGDITDTDTVVQVVVDSDMTATAEFVWLPAIGNPGNLLVTGFVGKNVAEFDRLDGAYLGELVAAGAGGLTLAGGIDVGPDGDVYVVNVGLTSTTSVLHYDGTTGAPEGAFVTGSGAIGFITLRFGPNGNLFVANNDSDTVEEYDGGSGAFVRTFVSAGSGGLDNPLGMAFGDSGNLFVVSENTNAVLEYEGSSGGFVGVAAALGDDGFTIPADLAFGPDGAMYVSVSDVDRVARVDMSNGVAAEFVAPGSGGLDSPAGLIFHPDTGNLLVVSQATDSVLEYDGSSGAFVGVFAEGAGSDNLFFLTFRPY